MALLLVISGLVSGQTPWITGPAGSGMDRLTDVAMDASGKVFVTGSFSNTVLLGGQSLSAFGATDVFVACFDGNGSLVWMRGAGGTEADRGTAIALDDNGDVLVTGTYSGMADLFGTAASSAGGTQDLFVAKLSGSTGLTLWTRTAGGAAGPDAARDVVFTSSGLVVVTGDFRGTCQFGGPFLTSVVDPQTQQFSADVFVAAWNGSGALQWLKHGAGSHQDVGVALAAAPSGGVHVTGRFSDTLMFDVPHPTPAENALFVVSLDELGQEQAFAYGAGPGVTESRGITVAPNGEVVLGGNLQGAMTWFDGTPDPITGTSTHDLFLLRLSPALASIGSAVWGSDAPMAMSGLVLHDDTVLVLGEFNCQFTGLADLYGGDGLFMAVGEEDIFVSAHPLPDLGPVRAQQLGGHGGKQAGGIAHHPATGTVVAGSFDRCLIVPGNGSTWADVTSANSCELFSLNEGQPAYCQDAHYGSFAADTAIGLFDGFVLRGPWLQREPYDIWDRQSGGACARQALDLCLHEPGTTYGACPDSLAGCGFVQLSVIDILHTPFSWREPTPPCPAPHYIGPEPAFLWSNGDTGHVTTYFDPGWAWCMVTTANGCWSWTDSVYLDIEAVPPVPLVSDGLGINSWSSNPWDIETCDPFVWLWCPNVPLGHSVEWTSAGGQQVPGDSILAATTDLYTVTITSPEGCTNSNQLLVVLGNGIVLMPSITDVYATFYTGMFGSGVPVGDTLVTCPTNCLIGYTQFAWEVNGQPATIDSTLQLGSWSLCGPPSNSTVYGTAIWSMGPVFTSGYQPLTLFLNVNNGPCGTDTLFFAPTAIVYVQMVEQPLLALDGPVALCPGDTAILTLDCQSCDSIAWYGAGIIALSQGLDTAWVVQPGTVTAVAWNSLGDVTCQGNASLSIQGPPVPPILTDPSDGVICPGDSALVYTTLPGSGFSWSGPDGTLPVDSPAVWVQVPGNYELVMTDVNGCDVAGGPATISVLGTPYLSTGPDSAICAGQPVVLEVFTSDTTTIQWLPPLSGGATTQVVDQPGTYACQVVHCGEVLQLEVTIASGGATAEVVDPGPHLICPDSVLVLEAVLGPYTFSWLPGGVAGPMFEVPGPGAYRLVATDSVGCSDTSDVALVQWVPFTDPAIVSAGPVCAGDTALLQAQGSGTFSWYADADLQLLLGTGPVLPIVAMPGDTVHLVQTENGCAGMPLAVPLPVVQVPPAVISGDTLACVGDTLFLIALLPGTDTLWWSTPAGPVGGMAVGPFSASPSDAGAYTLSGNWQGCTVPAVGVQVSVFPIPDPGLPHVVEACAGSEAQLAVLTEGAVLWSTGDTDPAITVSDPGTYWVQVTGASGCIGTDTTRVVIVDCSELEVPNVFSPNGDGRNDVVTIRSPSDAPLGWEIRNRWGQLVYRAEARVVSWDGRQGLDGEPAPDGVYFHTLRWTDAEGKVRTRAGVVHLLR